MTDLDKIEQIYANLKNQAILLEYIFGEIGDVYDDLHLHIHFLELAVNKTKKVYMEMKITSIAK